MIGLVSAELISFLCVEPMRCNIESADGFGLGGEERKMGRIIFKGEGTKKKSVIDRLVTRGDKAGLVRYPTEGAEKRK